MRLRWITVLSTLFLKLCLLAAVLLLARAVLNRNYASLEREHMQSDLEHVCVILRSQLADLDAMATDYAEWNDTYHYMKYRSPSYVNSDISDSVFKLRRVHIYLLVDERYRVAFASAVSPELQQTLPADIEQLVRAIKRRSNPAAPLKGLITLSGGPALVSLRPILPSRGVAAARGVLVMVRALGPSEMEQLSHLAGHSVSISGTVGESAEIPANEQLVPVQFTVVPLGDRYLKGTVMLRDIWGQTRIRVQMDHYRAIWEEGQQTIRTLVLALVLIGLLFALVNVWLIQRFVVRRVEQLIQLTNETETETGLNARVEISGSDELAELGHRMNQMLERLQHSNERLLGVQERLRFEASHDSLTGLWNRSAALQLLDQELARCSRSSSPVAVIMLDADNFKRINDHFGHSTGDRALQAIAAAITRKLRTSDVCCRYGGEEFMVLAPNCDMEQGAHLAERILRQVRSEPVTIPEHSFCVTLSAGVTAGTAFLSAEDMIQVADRALYRAKEKGRNRVETEAMPPQGKRIRSEVFALLPASGLSGSA